MSPQRSFGEIDLYVDHYERDVEVIDFLIEVIIERSDVKYNDSSDDLESEEFGPKLGKKSSPISGDEKEDNIKWHEGMKFTNIDEFRDTVRQYGIRERSGVQFLANDAKKCQVSCEPDCRFYLWCSKDRDSENCTIQNVSTEHNCRKRSEEVSGCKSNQVEEKLRGDVGNEESMNQEDGPRLQD